MFTKTAILLAAANLAAAHSTFQSFVINGKDQGHHFAVQTPSNGNNPILDVTSTAMICNGGKPTADQVEVAAGSTIGMQWHHNDPQNDAGDKEDPIAPSHRGPVMVYMASADTKGEGAVWTKIWEDGFKDGKFGVDRFYDNKGLIEVKLPNVKPGNYWIRPEMIGLHEATQVGKAQFYNGCGQIKVTGSGTVSLPATGVDMTKAYKASDAGVMFNIYSGSITSYPVPGPKVWDGASSGSSTPSTGSGSSTTPATGSSSPSPSPVQANQPAASKPAQTTTPSTGSGSSSGSGSALPKTFTISEFIQWLQKTAGTSSKARRHPRAFN
ncbi:lytic polysaccharide monooxygenase [Curvularia clavata]|uniref:AA9 family lytic polysaccharide monooxygenase n=1 Tax=Curvularia clavata TaxID=95742 RepID=A0A9Q8ZCK1_CURCL|nr:lytic polysaccharide monooxygenase [Curvularia clavata]